MSTDVTTEGQVLIEVPAYPVSPAISSLTRTAAPGSRPSCSRTCSASSAASSLGLIVAAPDQPPLENSASLSISAGSRVPGRSGISSTTSYCVTALLGVSPAVNAPISKLACS